MPAVSQRHVLKMKRPGRVVRMVVRVQPDGSGNGFGWGQLSHALAWVLFVGALSVEEATAITHRSARSGAEPN